jgi:hypothetical protein
MQTTNLEEENEWKNFWTDLMTKPKSSKRKNIEEKALEKIYHDFESTVACPKTTLLHDLKEAGYNDMVEKVIQGNYDF